MAGQGKFAGGEIEALEYPACPGDAGEPEWDGWVEADEEEAAEQARGRAKNVRAAMSGGAMDEGTLENERRSFEAGRERGRGEGREAQARRSQRKRIDISGSSRRWWCDSPKSATAI